MEHEFERQLRTLAIERRPEACLGCGFEHGCSVHGCAVIHAAAERLAAYEETGLEPEEIMEAVKLFSGTNVDVPKEIIGWVKRATWHCKRLAELTRLVSFDRLRQLAEAEKEGQLVVLSEPMKPMVYKPNDTDVYCPSCGESLSGGWPLSDTDDLRKLCQCPNCGRSIDDTRCEAAEAALKEREAIQNVLDKQDKG